MTAAIRQLGHRVNHKTVQRLMVKMGLKSLVRPKKYGSYKGGVRRTAPDLIKRQFTAQSDQSEMGDGYHGVKCG